MNKTQETRREREAHTHKKKIYRQGIKNHNTQARWVKKKKRKAKMSKKSNVRGEVRNYHCICFVLFMYCGSWDLSLTVVKITCETPLEKRNFTFLR